MTAVYAAASSVAHNKQTGGCMLQIQNKSETPAVLAVHQTL